MQFAHFGSEPEKLPPPHPALPYDVTAGAPHSAESAPSHGAAPRSLQAPHLHHPTAPRSHLFTPSHPCRSMMPGTYCPTTPSRAYSQRCTCAAPWRRERIDPGRRTCATPCCQAPRRSQYRAGSVSPPSALLQSCRKSGNKKVIKIATFLRLAIAADVQITNRAPKMKQNDRSVPHFHFAGDKKEPLIAKKLQKRQDFCFRKANYRNRSRFRNQTITKRGANPAMN